MKAKKRHWQIDEFFRGGWGGGGGQGPRTGKSVGIFILTSKKPIGGGGGVTPYPPPRGADPGFLKGGGAQIRSTTGARLASNFGPNVKNPTKILHPLLPPPDPLLNVDWGTGWPGPENGYM